MSATALLERFIEETPATLGCRRCRDGEQFPLAIRMAFQPIVDSADGSIFAYEALVRGPAGEGAAAVLGQVGPS